MTENKRFQMWGEEVIDTWGIIPSTIWGVKECQKKYCDELNKLHNENQELKKLNIPLDEVKETVVDCKGRIVGLYYYD